MTHTPGPWHYDGQNSITADFFGVGICILEPLEDFWSGDVARYPTGDEYEANARLIAAAPSLLAACESSAALLRRLGGHNHDPEYSELLSAIARANGDTNG